VVQQAAQQYQVAQVQQVAPLQEVVQQVVAALQVAYLNSSVFCAGFH